VEISRNAACSLAAIVGLPLAVVVPGAAAAAVSDPAPTTPTTCLTSVPSIGPSYAKKVSDKTSQLVVVRGKKKKSSYNKVEYWERDAGCWSLVKLVSGRNGAAGWSKKATDGSLLSPVGVFSLTDAGGRLPNPGTTLPYHYGPQAYSKFGYRMNNKTVQVFDYVVAINFNRNIGKPPRDEGRPNPKIRDGGIWFHVSGAGATRGCVSVKEANMAWTLRWLKPGKQPMIVMGPKTTIKG